MSSSNAAQDKEDSTGIDSRKSMEETLFKLSNAAKTNLVHRSHFVTSVLSVSDDRSSVKVKLCTGRIIDVPTSVLKNVTPLGTATSGSESWGIASGEIDVSTGVGILIQEMAHEITRLSRSLQITQGALLRLRGTDTNKPLTRAEDTTATDSKTSVVPFDQVLPEQIVKIPFTGLAGFPKAVVYAAPFSQYIEEWSVFNTVNCYLTQSPQIIETGGPAGRPPQVLEIQFVLDAAHGTPIWSTYNAQLVLDVKLVQFTT
jgi:hypothetical protein